MCLIFVAVRPDDDHLLVVAANRDEHYARPTAQASFWQDHPHVLAGRDLQAGGTWLGVTRSGRFAAVTNFREDPPEPLPPLSRGELTAGFLNSTLNPTAYLTNIDRQRNNFRGFNLILSDGEETTYYSNREGKIRALSPGTYGLSNQLLDCDWPKVVDGRRQFNSLAAAGFPREDLFALLACQGDGSPFSQRFIATESYGTSASTVVRIKVDGSIEFEERNFGPMGEPDRVHQFLIKG